MDELHILLTPNKEHRKVFPDVLFVGFRNGKSLEDYLVRAKSFRLDEIGKRELCGKKNLIGLWFYKYYRNFYYRSMPRNFCHSERSFELWFRKSASPIKMESL